MAANVKSRPETSPRTVSFSGKHPELSGDMPESFRKAPPQHRAFDHARDPYFSRQLKAMELTEAQRRGESERTGRGSQMVKLDKPFPELRPEHEQTPIRESFNRAWLNEQRDARLADLERQRDERQQVMEQAEQTMQRDWETGRQEQRVPER